MASHKTVIFDFDGTLADTAPVIRSIYMEMASKNKWTVMTDDQYEILRRGSFAAARKWAGIKYWQLPQLVSAGKNLMRTEASKLQLFPGIPELIQELASKEVKIYILSRNTSHTIKHVLARYGLEDYVEVIDRHFMNFGSKGKAIKRLLRRKRYNKNDVWMVGDEIRDMQAANYAEVNSIAVGWGFQHLSILQTFDPTTQADDVPELRKILLEII